MLNWFTIYFIVGFHEFEGIIGYVTKELDLWSVEHVDQATKGSCFATLTRLCVEHQVS